MGSEKGSRAGRWGVAIFWCVVLVVAGVAFRLLKPSPASLKVIPTAPVPAKSP